MSIHQPSFRILKLLDRTIFLSCGRTVYYGPPGDISRFFTEFGMPIPREQNPAEFALDLVHKLQEHEKTNPKAMKPLIAFNQSWGLRNVPRCEPSIVCDSRVSLKEAIISSISSDRIIDGTIPNYANHCWNEVCNVIPYYNFHFCASNILRFYQVSISFNVN
jgi:ABC-type multidrug transport system ATPase subunit